MTGRGSIRSWGRKSAAADTATITLLRRGRPSGSRSSGGNGEIQVLTDAEDLVRGEPERVEVEQVVGRHAESSGPKDAVGMTSSSDVRASRPSAALNWTAPVVPSLLVNVATPRSPVSGEVEPSSVFVAGGGVGGAGCAVHPVTTARHAATATVLRTFENVPTGSG